MVLPSKYQSVALDDFDVLSASVFCAGARLSASGSGAVATAAQFPSWQPVADRQAIELGAIRSLERGIRSRSSPPAVVESDPGREPESWRSRIARVRRVPGPATFLNRHRIRGGYRLIDTAAALGWLNVPVRHELGNGISILVPLARRENRWS